MVNIRLGGKKLFLSIIIPTYNRSSLLEKSLKYITEQIIIVDVSFEVIIVDDGSSDNTKDVFEKYKKKVSHIKYIFRERDDLSGRARARNAGIEASQGLWITFLDCGVLIPNDFVGNIYSITKERGEKLVVYHSVLGMYVEPEKDDVSVIDCVSPTNFKKITEELSGIPEWIDRRAGLFEMTNNELSNLSAPWSIGWTAALTTSNYLLKKIGGFDDAFLGWGAEDTDMCYRLFKEGALFIADQASTCLHIPHLSSSESSNEKTLSNARNELMLHRKQYSFDTELYLYYPGPYYSQALSKYNNLVLQHIIPRYKTKLFECINQIISNSSRVATIGIDNFAFINQLNTATDIFVQNKNTFNYLGVRFPDKNIVYLLGVNTPFLDKYFDAIIVSDYFRIFSEKILKDFIQELLRISKRLFFIYTESFSSVLKKVENASWIEYENLIIITQENNINVVEIEENNKSKIFEIINNI